MFFLSNKKVIGLDIGSSSIKMAQLTVGKNDATLEDFAFIQTPSGAIANSEIIDSVLLADSIRTLFRENKFKNKNCCVGLSGTAVIVKKIAMPRVDPKVIFEQIQYEASQYLPFDISQVTLDYHILPFSADPEKLEIIVVAAQNEYILNTLSSIKQTGLNCTILDVQSLALANIFQLNYGELNEAVALFNFGASITNFIVVFRGEVVFSRDIPAGGFLFTNEISKNMGVTLDEAESLKISYSNHQEVPEETRTHMNTALVQLTEEIKNSLDFYSANSQGLEISRVFYTGGASQTAGMIDSLTDGLKIAFEPFNPFRNMKNGSSHLSGDYLRQVTPFVSVVAGLGLRQVGDR